MSDEFVRKDVFEEVIKRMEALNAASEARAAAQIAEIRSEVKEYKAQAEVYRAESRRESESLASDIRGIKDRLDDMRSWMGVMGFGMTFAAIAIAAVQVWLALR